MPPVATLSPAAPVSPVFHPATTPLIPAAHQPAVLAGHLASLDLDPMLLWPGSGANAAMLADPQALLTVAQMLGLLRNAARALDDAELPFDLGRQMLPGHFGAASHALLGAHSLRRALQVLCVQSARLSPWLVPHLVVEGSHATLYWTDACASAGMRAFLVELQMSAVTAACQWLAGVRLPWQYCFNRGAPRSRDAHEVHLGSLLRFGCHIDAMVIEAEWLDRPWTSPQRLPAGAVTDALDREALLQEPRRNLLALLYEHLMARVRQAPRLEDSAAAFGMSAATFKRRLAACGTHYQAELDQVRLHTALRLIHGQGLDNDAIGRYLGFDDAANFRRSMKRWAGLTPARLRLMLAGAAG